MLVMSFRTRVCAVVTGDRDAVLSSRPAVNHDVSSYIYSLK